MSNQTTNFADLNELVTELRAKLEYKKYLLLFAYNGIGKTRLSMAFKEAGKTEDKRDTLYFNAFTEDLFNWDNDLASDLDEDAQRVLKINSDSRFFTGLQGLEMDSRIRTFLARYADFDFKIVTDEDNKSFVRFKREVHNGEISETIEHIKISRGEENIFIWCFFLSIVQLVIDDQESYAWVKYIYIDDPISSLDDNNAIAVASHLAQLLKNQDNVKTIISSHHTLFFSVMCNALNAKNKAYFLSKSKDLEFYSLYDTSDTPFSYHVDLLKQMHEAVKSGKLHTYHFNMLRNILEKTATFHGFKKFSDCIKQEDDDPEGIVHARMINVLSHGNYSLFEPMEMLDENKQHFEKILKNFMSNYQFNPELFPKYIE